MSGHTKRDSRFRTITRDSGKVFVTWFGARFGRPPVSAFKVSEEVELLPGSTLRAAVIRPKDRREATPESWPFIGCEGGPRKRQEVEAEWTKVVQELESKAVSEAIHAPEKEPEPSDILEEQTVRQRGHLPHVSSEQPAHARLRNLAMEHDYAGMTLHAHVQFVKEEDAQRFRRTAHARGFDVDPDVTQAANGRHQVSVHLK